MQRSLTFFTMLKPIVGRFLSRDVRQFGLYIIAGLSMFPLFVNAQEVQAKEALNLSQAISFALAEHPEMSVFGHQRKALDAKVKQAAKLCQDLIDGAIGGKKPSAKIKKMIEMQVGKSSSPEADAYRFISNVGSKLSRLYEYYGYYLDAIQKQKEDEKKYGKDVAFGTADVEGYAKDVQQYYNYIMKGQFR